MFSLLFVAAIIVTIDTTAGDNDGGKHQRIEIDHEPCNISGKNTTIVSVGNCVTCDPSTCSAVNGPCNMIFEFSENFTIKDGRIFSRKSASTCQELTTMTCGLFNREGVLCTKCKQGYGPPLYSNSLKCEICNDKFSGWWLLLYLLLELVPLTFFFLLSIIFNFHATAPPLSALVLFCQIFTILFRQSVYFKINAGLRGNPTLIQIASAFISFWNLDIFRSIIPPFCVSSELTDLHDLLLEYAFTLYPLILVIITYIGIELHARNVRPIVILWKPFHRLFHLRRSLDPRSSVIATFSTFISLSFSKLMFITFIITYPSFYGNEEYQRLISLVNPKIIVPKSYDRFSYYQQLLSTWYFIPLVIMSIVINLPTILLLLYPMKCFRKLLSYCGPKKYYAIYVFLDTFQGHYKDGTNGTRDYRAASCISFILRIPVYYLLNKNLQYSAQYRFLAFLLLLTAFFYSIVQPCKKRYVNNMESILYGIAGMLVTYYESFGIKDHYNMDSRIGFNFSVIMILLPSIFPFCSFIYKKLRCYYIAMRCTKSSLLPQNDISAPNSMVNPLQYTPIP